MIELALNGWTFLVDMDRTMADSVDLARDHCTCGYCRNYYLGIDATYPQLRSFLAQFGVDPEGPIELMPFEPTVCLAVYRVYGSVIKRGPGFLLGENIPVSIQEEDDTIFLLIGELELPWTLEEDMDEVVSPANTPEYLSRMEAFQLSRSPETFFLS